jgi:hypothetical protein
MLKVTEERVRSKAVSGFISQRYGSAHPDPHQNVMDSQYCLHGQTDRENI